MLVDSGANYDDYTITILNSEKDLNIDKLVIANINCLYAVASELEKGYRHVKNNEVVGINSS